MGFLSNRSSYAFNALEEEQAIANRLQRSGKDVLKLNRGDNTAFFPTPDYIKNAYIKAIKEDKNSYAYSIGVPELQDSIINRYKRMFGLGLDKKSVIVTQGVSEALYFLNSALINKDENAILFRPYYTQYVPYLRLSDGVPYFLDYDESSGWNIDTGMLEAHIKKMKDKKKIKYILITNPNNPTGTVLNKKVLEEVVDLANEHDLLLVSDEIYDEIIYNNAKFTSVCEIAKGTPYIILNGISKTYNATGFRIGYILVPEHDKKSNEIKEKFAGYSSVRLSTNTPAQYASAEAIGNYSMHKKELAKMVGKIEKKANLIIKMLKENENVSVVRPQGAFYVFPKVDLKALNFKDDKQFVHALLKEKYVLLSRGSGFGAPGHVRIISLPDERVIANAINRFNDFCKRHSN